MIRTKNITAQNIIAWIVIFLLSFPVIMISIQMMSHAITGYPNSLELMVNTRGMNLLGRSFLLATMVVIFTSVISFPLAYIFANRQFPSKQFLFFLILSPFFIPPYIYAIGWISFTDPGGLLDALNVNIFGFWGSVYVLTCWLYPLAFFFFLSTMHVGRRLKDAALLIAGKTKILTKIILPLISPGLVAGVLFTAILAITNFSVPSALRLNVYPSEIFIQYGAFFNHKDALILSLPLILLVMVILILIRKRYIQGGFEKQLDTNQTVLKGLNRNKQFLLYSGILILITFVMILPVLALLDGIGNLEVFTNTFVDTMPESWNSIFHGFLSATVLTILGFLLANFRSRLTNRFFKLLLDVLILMQISIPGTIYGITIIQIIQFNPVLNILSNPFPVVILSNLRYLPVSYFICIAGLSAVPDRYLEAASLVSIGNWKYIKSILLPLMKYSIIGSFIILFVLVFGELDAAILVFPPGFETLPVRIYSLLHYGANDSVYALSVLQVMVIYTIIVIGFQWIRKSLRIYA